MSIKNIGRNHYQSISKKLLSSNITNKSFEDIINNISIEDLIALKLEVSARLVKGKFYGFPIWKTIDYIIKESLIKFALSSTKTQKEAANVLGINISDLKVYIKKYDINKELD